MDTGSLTTLSSVILTCVGSLLLYLSSENQRLVLAPPRRRITLLLGGVLTLAGLLGCVAVWGGLVGGLIALGIWMVTSVALPYFAGWRNKK